LLATGNDTTRVQSAEAELKKELVISPSDFLTYAALGKIAISQYRYTEAGRYLKRATELDPKSPDAFLYLGEMYVDTGRPADAEAALRQSIRLTTDVSHNRYQVQKAHFLLGRLLMQQHKEEEAHAEMKTAHALLDKGLSEDKSKLAGLLDTPGVIESANTSMNFTGSPPGTGETANPEAIRRLNAFEKRVTPAVADSYNNLGAIAAEGKDYADALTNFQRAAEWNPSFDGLDYNWGRAAFSASRFGDAIMPLSRYLRSHQDDSGIRAALGISQFMTHDYDGCIRTLQPAEGDLNSIPQVQYVYADSLVKTGQFSSGMERLDSLEKSHPEIAEVHRALGEAFERQGQKQKAIEELKAAIGLNRNDPETHYVLGEVELESGDAGSAIPELESAIHLKSDDPKFHQALAIAYKLTLRTADAAREVQIYDALRAAQSKRSEIPSGSAAAWH